MSEKKQFRVRCNGACKHDSGACYVKYPPGRQAFEGEIVDDIPVALQATMVREGLVEPVDAVEGGEE